MDTVGFSQKSGINLASNTRQIQGSHFLTSPDPPESVGHHISVWKIEWRRKNQKSPKFVRSFSVIFPFSKVLGKSENNRPNPSAQKSYCGKQLRGFDFGFRPNSSALVQCGKIENIDFSNFFSSCFLKIHFSWISTESDVLWCIGALSPLPSTMGSSRPCSCNVPCCLKLLLQVIFLGY